MAGQTNPKGVNFVPEKLVRRVVWAQHTRNGHFWRRLLVREFSSPPSIDIWKEVAEVRAHCRVCQAREAEDQTLRVAERPQPVIDQFLTSFCSDVFDMPGETIDGRV